MDKRNDNLKKLKNKKWQKLIFFAEPRLLHPGICVDLVSKLLDSPFRLFFLRLWVWYILVMVFVVEG